MLRYLWSYLVKLTSALNRSQTRSEKNDQKLLNKINPLVHYYVLSISPNFTLTDFTYISHRQQFHFDRIVLSPYKYTITKFIYIFIQLLFTASILIIYSYVFDNDLSFKVIDNKFHNL